MNRYDVVVIGGGQSGLAVGYYLRRTGLSFIILDNRKTGGGAWNNMWESLRLFSPAQWSSLPGMIMPGGPDYYPTRIETIEYLLSYEARYNLPVKRNVSVQSVMRNGGEFVLNTSDGQYSAKVVISATGSAANTFIPEFPGAGRFKGKMLHSIDYRTADEFAGKRVAIVGEGNSGAQILSEVSNVAETVWITLKEPRFLPDHVDGRYLFDQATQMYEAQRSGKDYRPPSLGDIVMVESVKDARSRGVLKSLRPFSRFSENGVVWNDGREEKIDAIIFCTGFKSSLKHLEPLNILNAESRIETKGTRASAIEGLWLVGYGHWTGFASSTLIGVGRSARATVEEVIKYVPAFKESLVS